MSTAGHPVGVRQGMLIVVAIIAASSSAALAQITADERACEVATSRAWGKFERASLKCWEKCYKTDPVCGPTAAAAATTCVATAQSKATATELAKCPDCPECYAGGSCSDDGTARAAAVATDVQGVVSTAFCDDTASGDGLTPSESKCRLAISKTGGKLGQTLSKCAANCERLRGKGLTNGECGGAGATDTKTVACRTKAIAKAGVAVQKGCFDPGADAPDCATLSTPDAWVQALRVAVDRHYADTFCEPATCASGVQLYGGCWQLGALGQSCDAVCGTLGVDAATTAYAGSAGTDAGCNAVLDAVGAPAGNLPFVTTTCNVADECMLAIGGGDTQRARCVDTPSSNGAASAFHRRACACNGPLACGTFLFQWGSMGTGDGQFTTSFGVAVGPDGNVYVLESNGDRVQVFTNTGGFLRKWGTAGTGDGQFDNPNGIAVAPDGTVYVMDTGNNRVQKFTSTGTFLAKWGSFGTGDGQFQSASGIAADGSGNVFVADTLNDRIQKFTNTGTFLTKWGTVGSGDGQFDSAAGIAVDASGDVYTVEQGNARVQKFTNTGTFITKWGSNGSGNGQFDFPYWISVDASGTVWVSEILGVRVQHFTNTGTFLAKWGGYGTGPGEFQFCVGVAADPYGGVYVSDGDRIEKFACQ